MSKSKYEIEIERSQNDSKSTAITAFTGSVRTIGLNNLEDGDVVTIPADYKAFEQELPGTTAKAQYLIANVKRNGQDIALRFYPSSFTKMGKTCEPTNADKTEFRLTGKFETSTGDVVTAVQQHATVNDACKALVGKPFKVSLRPVYLLTYESRDKDSDLTADDVRKTTMPNYEFVK